MQKKLLTKLNIHSYKNSLNKLGIVGNVLNTVKSIYEKFIANIIINGEKLKAFPPRSSSR